MYVHRVRFGDGEIVTYQLRNQDLYEAFKRWLEARGTASGKPMAGYEVRKEDGSVTLLAFDHVASIKVEEAADDAPGTMGFVVGR